jgi:phage replication O-like protein O
MGEVIQMAARQRGDPQVEDGFTRFANELLEAICRTRFTTNESQILLFLARMTYGYSRKSARISTAEWVAGTEMKATHIYRTRVSRNIIKNGK